MTLNLNDRTIECIQGNIVDQPDISAIVNATNARLRTGGGVAGAIHSAAGPELTRLCEPLAPIEPGQAVITAAPNLPNDYVIHTRGPVYGADHPEAELLAKCYRESLTLADHYNCGSIAFPAISAGAFGYPLPRAAEIAVQTVRETLPELTQVRHVRFVLFSANDQDVFMNTLHNMGK